MRIFDLCERMHSDERALQASARDLFSSLTVRTGRHGGPRAPLNLPHALLAYERSLVLWALAQSRGQQKAAARLLGIRPSTLNAKMKRMAISRPHEEALQSSAEIGPLGPSPHG